MRLQQRWERRCEVLSDENGLTEISNFKSFADENAIFYIMLAICLGVFGVV